MNIVNSIKTAYLIVFGIVGAGGCINLSRLVYNRDKCKSVFISLGLTITRNLIGLIILETILHEYYKEEKSITVISALSKILTYNMISKIFTFYCTGGTKINENMYIRELLKEVFIGIILFKFHIELLKGYWDDMIGFYIFIILVMIVFTISALRPMRIFVPAGIRRSVVVVPELYTRISDTMKEMGVGHFDITQSAQKIESYIDYEPINIISNGLTTLIVINKSILDGYSFGVIGNLIYHHMEEYLSGYKFYVMYTHNILVHGLLLLLAVGVCTPYTSGLSFVDKYILFREITSILKQLLTMIFSYWCLYCERRILKKVSKYWDMTCMSSEDIKVYKENQVQRLGEFYLPELFYLYTEREIAKDIKMFHFLSQ
ncbi:hypothetical protein NEOKW01_1712 [Nematocida sp. AWRm80]|nr:hypothetical protein NEOKW01_1712 [Nematocida sp. AWRm80]